MVGILSISSNEVCLFAVILGEAKEQSHSQVPDCYAIS